MEVKGQQERLKIAPLLLTGIIDKLVSVDKKPGMANYTMQLHFLNATLHLLVKTGSNNSNIILLQDESIHTRLKELYPERYSISYSEDSSQFKLSIKLDEER